MPIQTILACWNVVKRKRCSKPPYLPLVILFSLLIGFVSIWSSNKKALGLMHDDGIYVVVAKALSHGAGHRIISLPTVPAQTKYPFLYSYILSWLWNLNPSFPDNIGLLKSANAAFLAVIFVLSYFFYRHRVPGEESDALLFATLVCINPAVFSFTDFTVSDILFLLLLLLAVATIDSPEPFAGRRSRITLLAVIVVLGCLTRSAAVPLAVAGVMHFAWSKRYRDLTQYLLLVIILIAPWWIWVRIHSDETATSLLDYYVSYSSEPPAFMIMWFDPLGATDIVWGNLRYIGDALDLIFQSTIIPGVWLPVGLLLLWGLWRSFNEESVFFRSYMLLYLGLVIAWPFDPTRYLIPLVPSLYFFLFRGVYAAEADLGKLTNGKRRKKLYSHLVRVIFAATVVLHIGWLSNYLFNEDAATTRVWFGKRLGASWQGFAETFEWIRDNTDESAVLATTLDPMYYLYTGRMAIQPGLHKPKTYFYPYGNAIPDVGSADEIRAGLESMGVEFVIMHPLKDDGEQDTYVKLWKKLSALYRDRPKLMFISSDSKHQIFAVPKE